MELTITAASHVGCIRTNNEDMLLVGNRFVRDDETSFDASFSMDDRYLLALADGMGGHNCGEVASEDTLHNLNFFFSDLPVGLNISEFYESVNGWLKSVNQFIDGKGRTDAQYRNMGTTLVAFVYYEHKFFWLNCGDSRLYRYHDGQLKQLTTDHSLSNMLGQKTHSNIITNCIGGGCRTNFIDVFDCTSEVEEGDTFLLCSDGLTDMVSDEDIATMLKGGCTASQLCSAAEQAGGLDNVSVILAHVHSLN